MEQSESHSCSNVASLLAAPRANPNPNTNSNPTQPRPHLQPKGYKGTSAEYETDYSAQIGSVGVAYPELTKIATDPSADVIDAPLECQPPAFWSTLAAEFSEFLEMMKVRNAVFTGYVRRPPNSSLRSSLVACRFLSASTPAAPPSP